MSQQPTKINVLGLEIAFRPGADMERVKFAVKLIEDRYADQKARMRESQSKDVLLTFLALGLADELLQMKTIQGQTQTRISSLVAKIEKSF